MLVSVPLNRHDNKSGKKVKCYIKQAAWSITSVIIKERNMITIIMFEIEIVLIHVFIEVINRRYRQTPCFRKTNNRFWITTKTLQIIIHLLGVHTSNNSDWHWRLSGSKFPQYSFTLLRIRTVFNNAFVWIIPTLSLIFNSSSLFPQCSSQRSHNDWNNSHLRVSQSPRLPNKVEILIHSCQFLSDSLPGLSMNSKFFYLKYTLLFLYNS